MKSVLLLIGIALLSFCCASAQTIEDPVRDYLMSRDLGKDPDMPYLKELRVIHCDLTNSGKQAILISFNGHGGRQGNYWTAYLPTSGGYVKADDDETTLTFREDTFYVGRVSGKYGLLAFAPGQGGGDLNLFQIINGKVTEQKVGTLDLSKPEDKKEFETYFGDAPNWKSRKDHPMTTKSLDDLRQGGYDVDGAIRAAKAATGAN
jgi:hypothetical protein